jgi:hypothetical protein
VILIKNTSLIFIFYPPRATNKNEFFYKIAEFIKNNYKQFKLIAVTIGKESKEFLNNNSIQWDKRYDIIEFIRNENSFSYSNFIKFTEKYKLYKLNEVYEHASVLFSKQFPGGNFTDKEKDEFMYSFLKFWENVLVENSNSILIDEGVASIFSPLYKLFPFFNSTVFNLTISRNDGYFVITTEEYQKWNRLEDTLQNNKYGKVDLEKAKEYVKDFLEKKYKPRWYYVEHKKNNKNKVSINSIFNKIKNVTRAYKYPENFFVRKKSIISKIKNKIKNNYKTSHYKKIDWDEFDEKSDYFVFPLHVYPEATINLLSPYYSNQLDLIRQISLALPTGILLYVKEHSAFIGKRESIKFYKEIQKLKNVKLIDPFLEPHDVIKNSLGIVTISSTMGFEAIMYNKPIILFGDAFYKSYKHAYFISNIRELNDILKRVKNIEIPDIEVYKFISAYLKELYEGNLYFYKDKNAYLDNNIKKVSNAIIEHIKYISDKTEV